MTASGDRLPRLVHGTITIAKGKVYCKPVNLLRPSLNCLELVFVGFGVSGLFCQE